MSSIGGLNVFTPGNIIYGSSKAALDSAMKFCALELAPNIRVNSIMPGMINTSLIKIDLLFQANSWQMTLRSIL